MARKYEDNHHILFNRQEWELRSESKLLRQTPSLIPRLDREVHEELHRACPAVPILGYYALFRTLRSFEESDDTLESVDSLMFAIEAAGNSPKAHPIERSIGELAVQAIDLQRPFIREGLVLNKQKRRYVA